MTVLSSPWNCQKPVGRKDQQHKMGSKERERAKWILDVADRVYMQSNDFTGEVSEEGPGPKM